MKISTFFLLLLFLLFSLATEASGKRLIVQLSAPPLSKHPNYATLRRKHASDRAANGDETSAALSPLRELVAQQQRSFLASLPEKWPVALLNTERGPSPAVFHRVLNAVTLRVPDADVDRARRLLLQLPGVVAVSEERTYNLLLHSSRKALGAFDAWAALNSTERDAGKGVKIAVLDSGIYTKNEMFSDGSMELPLEGDYPKGQTSNCNKKVIVSRLYSDPDNPPTGTDSNSYPSKSSSMHGIHCASTAAGSFTVTGYDGLTLGLSGVAPGAWLMNYRIFYTDNDGDTVATSETQILKAFDDLVADGADVVSNSWGAFAFYNEDTPIDHAVKGLVAAGVMTVFAAGNDGPGTLTVERYRPALRVGATTSGGALAKYVMTTSPSVGYDIEYLNAETLTKPVYGTYTLFGPEDDDTLACSPLRRSFKGNAAVVAMRGNCTFADKIKNIAAAGATLAIIGNSRDGGLDLVRMSAEGATINALFIGHEVGMDLIALAKNNSDQTVTVERPLRNKVVSYEKDILGDFSGRGPTTDMQLAPDLCAPGVKIYAAGYGYSGDYRLSFGEASGTSMACPHAAGASALVLAKHPEFTPSEVASALMSTANFINILDYDGTPGQPLEIGAGRIDLSRALDPPLFLDPPSLSFSLVSMDSPAGNVSRTFSLKPYGNASMELTLRAVHHTGRGAVESAPSWVRVVPSTLSLEAGAGPVNVTVFLDAAEGTTGDEQGYILIEDSTGSELAHLPYWARLTFKESERVDVYVIDADQSSFSELGPSDYLPLYTSALEGAGLTYKTWEYDAAEDTPFPAEVLARKSRAVIFFTGDVICDLKSRDSDIREIMHSGVPVFQMGVNIGASWGLSAKRTTTDIPNMKFEFKATFKEGSKTVTQVKGANYAPEPFASISSSAKCETRPLATNQYGKVFLMMDNKNNNLIQAYRYIPDLYERTEEEPKFNSLGILSVIGLECMEDSSARAKLLKALYDYSTETVGDYSISYTEDEPYYTVSVEYKNLRLLRVGWGDNTATEEKIKEGSTAKITHGYRMAGTYTPRVMVMTENGGYFELDTHGKKFVVQENHPEVSGASAVKSSGITLLLLVLLVAIMF